MGKKINIDEKKMLELYNSGMSNSAIGRYFGMGHNGISRRLEKYGLISHKIPSTIELIGDNMKCTKCEEYYPPAMFEKNGRFTRRQCTKCHNTQTVIRRFSTEERRIKYRINVAKDSSKKSGLPFDLDYEYMKNLLNEQNKKCFYSGKDIIFWQHGETPSRNVAPSIDKIVPANGYTKGNVVWCLERYNRMKNDATLEEMKEYMPLWYDKAIKFIQTYKF